MRAGKVAGWETGGGQPVAGMGFGGNCWKERWGERGQYMIGGVGHTCKEHEAGEGQRVEYVAHPERGRGSPHTEERLVEQL